MATCSFYKCRARRHVGLTDAEPHGNMFVSRMQSNASVSLMQSNRLVSQMQGGNMLASLLQSIWRHIRSTDAEPDLATCWLHLCRARYGNMLVLLTHSQIWPHVGFTKEEARGRRLTRIVLWYGLRISVREPGSLSRVNGA